MYFRPEFGQRVGDAPPYFSIGKQIVAMDQQVPEGNNLDGAGNLGGNGWLDASEPVHSLPDDFKIPFHRLAQLAILPIIFLRFAPCAIEDK